VDDLLAMNSEYVGLIVHAITFEDFPPMQKVMIHQRHRQTDRQTTSDSKTALCTAVHRKVKKRGLDQYGAKPHYSTLPFGNFVHQRLPV